MIRRARLEEGEEGEERGSNRCSQRKISSFHSTIKLWRDSVCVCVSVHSSDCC